MSGDNGTPASWDVRQVEELAATPINDPTFSSDLLEMYYGSGVPSHDIFRLVRPTNPGQWGAPQLVAPVNTSARENAPELVGNTLYFSTTRLTMSLERDIFMSTRGMREESWSMPAHVTELSTQDQSDLGVQANGLRAIVGTRVTQPEQADLVEWTRSTTMEAWANPRPLDELNSPHDDLNATLTADGLTVYFSSNHADGGNTHDLYVARRPALDQPFEAPIAIDQLNVPGMHDTDPWISPDGTVLFFTRASRLYEAHLVD